MKPVIILFAAVVGLFSASKAMAYGDAGCGLGSLIFKKNALISQLSAGTTNASFGSQTFGMTTGTSNCKVNGIAKINKEQIFYAESNYRHLVVEMAEGQGENLSAFAQVMGCPESVHQNFGKMTKSKYETIFPNQETTPLQMLESVKKNIEADPQLSTTCKTVG